MKKKSYFPPSFIWFQEKNKNKTEASSVNQFCKSQHRSRTLQASVEHPASKTDYFVWKKWENCTITVLDIYICVCYNSETQHWTGFGFGFGVGWVGGIFRASLILPLCHMSQHPFEFIFIFSRHHFASSIIPLTHYLLHLSLLLSSNHY